MPKDIGVEEAFDIARASFIDVRSPTEFERDTIPGAANVPLFNDEERRRIGQIYAGQGSHEARKLGMEIVAPKLPGLVEQIIAQKKDHQLVIFCWRGGDRSKAVARIMDIMHVPCFRLEGGYRAYRQYVNRILHENELSHACVVLHGLTGTGKTEMIKELGRRGHPILDLEGLASHRGSVFGGIGLSNQPSQKRFESLIWEQIKGHAIDKFLIVEGESKKIGKLYIPDAVYKGMLKGYKVLLDDTMENRVKRLIQDYVRDCKGSIGQMAEALDHLVRRLGKAKVKYLHQLLESGELEQVGIILLRDYYDLLYGEYIDREQYDLRVDAGNWGQAIRQIEEYVQHFI